MNQYQIILNAKIVKILQMNAKYVQLHQERYYVINAILQHLINIYK